MRTEENVKLYQFEGDYRNIDCGMFYVLELPSHSFFLIDSAQEESVLDHERYHAFLKTHTPEGDKIHIAGWLLTHAHDDHIHKFMEFVDTYDDFVLDAVYYTFPEPDHPSSGLWKPKDILYLQLFKKFREKYKSLNFITLHRGDSIDIEGLHFDILMTYEDVDQTNIYNFNNTSIVMMMTYRDCKVFWPADIGQLETDYVIENYGSRLKADIMQLGHHGFRGPSSELYELVNAPVVLAPSKCNRFWYAQQFPSTAKAMELAEEVYIADEGTVCLTLPYKKGTAVKYPCEIYNAAGDELKENAVLEALRECLKQKSRILKSELPEKEAVAEIFEKCFMNTVSTTVESPEMKEIFVITGDIPAMWLRDSSMQVIHYLDMINENPAVKEIIRGLIIRQFICILNDPYANAFMKGEDDVSKHAADITEAGKLVWERKFEIDSLCFPIWLMYEYFKRTEDRSLFRDVVWDGIEKVLEVFECETEHKNNSKYTFERNNGKEKDTLKNGGLGPECKVTGMIWSGFRPSDDACKFSYNIPGNLFAISVLKKLKNIMQRVYDLLPDDIKPEARKENEVRIGNIVSKADELIESINKGIDKYGFVTDPDFGKMYAYEIDGLGNCELIDDANIPSLLSLPMICPDDIYSKEMYENTRKYILSKKNPYFFEGKEGAGIGSPHTKDGYIWPIALCVQGLTASSTEEKYRILEILVKSSSGTGYMHESFSAEKVTEYTREWFAWANSMFAYYVMSLIKDID